MAFLGLAAFNATAVVKALLRVLAPSKRRLHGPCDGLQLPRDRPARYRDAEHCRGAQPDHLQTQQRDKQAGS